jgi:hypothetical protein
MEDYVVYERVLATDPKTPGAPLTKDGKPHFKSLTLPTEIAATVNIAPSTVNVPRADVPELQPPCRALQDDEELCISSSTTGATPSRRGRRKAPWGNPAWI